MELEVSKEIQAEAMKQVKKWSEIVTIFLKTVLPSVAISIRVVPSLFFYFITNFDNEALELPAPMW